MQNSHWGLLPLCRGAVGVFNSLSWLGKVWLGFNLLTMESFMSCTWYLYWKVNLSNKIRATSIWVSIVPGEHCQKIAVSNPTQAGQRFTWSKTWCDRQQLWKAVITGDTVTRLSIPIRGRGKSPEEGQRWNLAET